MFPREKSRTGFVWLAAAAVLSVSSFSQPAFAGQNSCEKPSMPVLPTSISYKLQADILGGQLNALSSASARYLQCLETFARENDNKLSAEDLAELRQKQTSYVTSFRNYATKWNAMIGEYRAKQSPRAK